MAKTVLIVWTIIVAMTLPLVSAREQRRRLDQAYYTCTSPGFQCASCNQAVLCDYDPFGNLVSYEGDKCEGGRTCLEGKCTDSYNENCHPTLNIFVFKCRQQGTFPDPFDCKKYHVCSEVDVISKGIRCPHPWAFEPRTLMCTTNMNFGCPSRPVKPCQNLGQGPIKGNPFLYYMCNKDVTLDPTSTYYFPNVMRCPEGMKFLDGRCHDMSKDQNVVGGTCTTSGRFYAAGRPCSDFNQCVVYEKPILRSCNAGDYFSRDFMLCMPFICPDIN